VCLFEFVCLFVLSLWEKGRGWGRKLSTSDLGDHAVCLTLIEAANRVVVVVVVVVHIMCHVADKLQNS